MDSDTEQNVEETIDEKSKNPLYTIDGKSIDDFTKVRAHQY